MAGPTPVSALIHAATMVTAGVYLIARTHALLALAPAVQTAAAVIGAATLLYAGFSALVQTDVKRMLAYSTISQVGYMFLALGVGAWSAAIFHFMTHAFFKALLFMAAGVVILRLRHEQNMLRMGGLRKELPGAFWAFLIGAASLSALPLVTAGFYSKDLILSRAWTPASGSPWLWGAGLAGALLTSLYAFRAVFLIFFGEAKQRPEGRTGLCMEIPLTALSVLAIAGGWINVPAFLRGNGGRTAGWLGYCPGVVSVIGILAAWHLFLRRADATRKLTETPLSAALENFWLNGWGFDWAYDRLFVRPFVWLARVNRDDFVDAFTTWVAGLFSALHGLLSATQTGRLRWYAVAIVIGAILILGIVTLL
jgi:NADH-quinone oxidoreductase subunit L